MQEWILIFAVGIALCPSFQIWEEAMLEVRIPVSENRQVHSGF